ncbi:GntR family transcriptional regulator [Mesorhizobium sp. ASY16-5R]|uniref:GntR family transcriptional regulator n=1 Tax=Mesorhizobium sp. ASY16-5R TaxID=3445772 RepID=UPI003FA06F52
MSEHDHSPLLSEKAYQQIEEMIVMRRFPPGSMISENQLSASLGCGRTPIREALLRLKLEGFVDIHPRRGALVLPVDIAKQLELLEVRRPLETLTTELGCRRATPAQRAEMRALGARLVEAAAAGMDSRYFQLNRTIHDLRIAATHNQVLVQSMGVIYGLSRWFWYSYLNDPAALLEAAELHKALLDAIAAGDTHAAVAASDEVVEFVSRLTQNEIDRRS